MHAWDETGRKFLDLTAAFGVAALGHAHPKITAAACKQIKTLLHAMGDVHPHALKANLMRELSRITFERWGAGEAKTILCNSGFEAVEAALKTAFLLTGRERIVAFEGAYHGLGYGALNATHREHFRSPFRKQLAEFAVFMRWPETEQDLNQLAERLRAAMQVSNAGALLVEPIQARGGIRVPPPGFLRMLREICDEQKTVLILDEIYTGFGRAGRWFACEREAVVPDLICLGKALTGGFPLSACVGKSELMDRAWPPSSGEAIHTSTFLGHPVGCAMALANIHELESGSWIEHAEEVGNEMLAELRSWPNKINHLLVTPRGAGLMLGIQLDYHDGPPATRESLAVIKALLGRGMIFLPEGEFANVISLTPPLIISKRLARKTLAAIRKELERISPV
jgi:4-aminobutyrate aminotransferase-like enzyme